MARQTGIRAQINHWHQEFHSVRDAWVEWLKLNGANYSTVEEAWRAFKAQLPGNNQGSASGTLAPRSKDYKMEL